MTYQLYWRRGRAFGAACHRFRFVAEVHKAILAISGATSVELLECEPV